MTDPTTIVLVGNPAWANALTSALPPHIQLRHYTQRARYVANLTDHRAALVLIDGQADDWPFYTTAAKSNNATRRVPLIVVTADEITRADALTHGADLALSPDDLLADVPSLIAQHARVADAAQQQQLLTECDQPLPPLAVQGVEKFNNREFYPQHDLFEEQWVETDGPVRDLYRAVLQVGVAYYQIERGNHRGALKMLLRAVQWLEPLPDVCQTINVKQLREDAYAVRAELERTDPADIDTFDMSLLKPVQRV